MLSLCCCRVVVVLSCVLLRVHVLLTNSISQYTITHRSTVLKESLNEMFEATGGYGVWNETRGWDGKADRLSLYHGVVVNRDEDDGEYDVNPLKLLSLALPSNCMVGNFRKAFKLLFVTTGKNLRILNLSRNELNYKKGLPKELSSCLHLTTLLLENTGGTGSMPEDEGVLLLPSLQVLSLSGNSFEGSPEMLFKISNNLRVLNLSNNIFDGIIEKEWLEPLRGSIESLDLSYNRLGGLFLTDFSCKLLGPTIKHLKVSGNAMVGSLPPEIKHCNSLEVLHLDSNNFNGMLPEEFFKLKHLRRLWLENNNFIGDLTKFVKFKEMRTLVLGGNGFGEEIPDTLSKLKFLKNFRINDCRFVGSFPMSLLLKMKLLQKFDVSGCKYMAQNSIKRAMEFAQEKGIKCGR